MAGRESERGRETARSLRFEEALPPHCVWITYCDCWDRWIASHTQGTAAPAPQGTAAPAALPRSARGLGWRSMDSAKVLVLPIFRRYWLWHAWADPLAAERAAAMPLRTWRDGTNLEERFHFLGQQLGRKVGARGVPASGRVEGRRHPRVAAAVPPPAGRASPAPAAWPLCAC